ncbi:MAG: hypothetical protein BWK80_06285 [Desulfobacteraceae bacterium IS3]|nr:MAG: hypothetical protein BWK80_06285 [Desulfobacteraceae bacterium IS3]
MKSDPSGASGASFKIDSDSIEPETLNIRQKTRRSRRGKTSLAIIIVAALILISDGILVGVFVSRYLHRVNDRKADPPQHIEIKSFSYHKTDQIISHTDASPKPFIEVQPVKKDSVQTQIKDEKIQIYSWVDEKGIKHYSDTAPSVQVEKLSDRSR